MNQHQVYLKGELNKLRNRGDAQGFMSKSGCAEGEFGLQLSEVWLAHRFATQALVDDFVDSLDERALVALTARCGQWRNNGVAAKLQGRRIEFLSVAVEDILVCQAEPHLGHDFERLGWRLAAVAHDPVVLDDDAYKGKDSSERIDFTWCLARPEPGRPGTYWIFDGVHRAIQMVRNGETHVPLCVVYP